MTVPFNTIPTALRVPLFYAEVDRSAANQGGDEIKRTLLVGQRRSTGTVAAGVLTRVTSAAAAAQLFGIGSMLHLMAEAYFAGDGLGEVWAIALDDNGAGVAATGSIRVMVLGSAGVIPLYIAGRSIPVPVLAGDTKPLLATRIMQAVTDAFGLPVSAVSDGIDKVTFTALNKGTLGNKIDVRLGYQGEAMPNGLQLTIVGMNGGATDPLTGAAVDAMGDEPFEFIAWPYVAGGGLGAIGAELDDSANGRWGPLRQLYGHAVSFMSGTVGELDAEGGLHNDPHVSLVGLYGSPTWPPAAAAAVTAAVATGIRVDPARPLQTIPVPAILPPAKGDRFTIVERNALLYAGIATLAINPRTGAASLERVITTYQTNAFGTPDESCLDCETLFTIAESIRRLKAAITSKYPRHKLVSDGTRLAPGQPAVSPSTLRAELVAAYDRMEDDGLVENVDAFAAGLIVERNASNPSRVDVLFPPDLANGLRIFALLNQFRLQYA